MWIDVTWGAGGSTAEKTLEICINALKYHGLDVMMHLTCTNMEKAELHRALTTCKENGICNILALRGDPPAGVNGGEWKACEGGFAYAVDLVKFIREEFGDYFCIAVAGYPEGHLEAESKDSDLRYLKEKVDAGADMIVTQLFYDNGEFFDYVDKVKALGITVPVLPGIMPIQSYGGFTRMTSLCKTKLPPSIMEELEPIKDDDQKVKDYGVQLATKMCQELLDRGTPGLHFYTLNLETSCMRIVKDLGLISDWAQTRELPWKQSAETKRKGEDVRPIFWANRPHSYFKRTAAWDDFPNGRFGNAASPAFGECVFHSYGRESSEKVHQERRQMWGTPVTVREVGDVFIGFLRGTVKRLPWCQEGPTAESGSIAKTLVRYNQLGLLTINSQPRVNGSLSTDPNVGWGPANGFVYQKAYAEFFCSPESLAKLIKGIEDEKLRFLSYTAVNEAGQVRSNVDDRNVNAVTWGIFPGKEVVQPTVVDSQSFLVWKDEAFALWSEWSDIYDPAAPSGRLIETIQSTWYLVNLVDNNFVSGDLASDLFRIFA